MDDEGREGFGAEGLCRGEQEGAGECGARGRAVEHECQVAGRAIGRSDRLAVGIKMRQAYSIQQKLRRVVAAVAACGCHARLGHDSGEAAEDKAQGKKRVKKRATDHENKCSARHLGTPSDKNETGRAGAGQVGVGRRMKRNHPARDIPAG